MSSEEKKKLIVASMNRVAEKNIRDQRKQHRVRFGRRTRLSFTEYMIELLMLNENRTDCPKPLTDIMLKAEVLREFGHYADLSKSWVDGHMSVSQYRIFFNKGKLLPNHWPHDNPGRPPVLSLRYSSWGYPVNPKSRYKKVSNAWLLERLASYPQVQETPESLLSRLNRTMVDGVYPPDALE